MADDRDIEGRDLAAIIASELRTAKRYADEDLTSRRTRNIEYYQGIMTDTAPAPNRSSVVSRDVSDVIGWMLPGIIRVFTASDQMAMYEPETERDREFAQQASDYANFVYFRDNDGYRTLYEATFDSLLVGNGIVRHYWDPTPTREITMHSGLVPEQLAQLTEDEDVEILTQEQGQPIAVPAADPMTGQPMLMHVPTFNVKVSRIKSRGKVCIHAGKPENFYLDPAAVTIEEARFCAYLHDNRTRSDLVEMGFDRDEVEDLPADNLSLSDEEGLARERMASVYRYDSLKSTQMIDLYECYLKADVDDDGIAETVQVWYAGNGGAGKVLDWQVWEDELPFSDIPCYPMAHRFEAESTADRTRDVQKVKTVLLRQGLDNLYASNLPMREAEAGSVLNPDILVAPKFGGIIWRKPGSQPIVPHLVPFVADKAFTAMDYMDMVVAKRTGVSRTTMALDPEALQNQTATATQQQRDAGYSQIELVARNQAELGWKRVFRCLLKLIVQHQDQPRIIRLRDEFVQMDPRSWNANMDATVNVGLGTGSRDRDMLMLQQVLMDQLGLADRFMGAGAQEQAIDLLPRIVSTMKKKAESAGLKNPDAFYPEFGEEDVAGMKQMAQQASQQPSPQEKIEQAKIAAQAQIEMQKMQANAEAEKMKAQGNAVKEQAQMEADLRVKEAERQNAMIIEGERIASAERMQAQELAFKREELGVKTQLEAMKMANAQQIAATKQPPQPSA